MLGTEQEPLVAQQDRRLGLAATPTKTDHTRRALKRDVNALET